jgi:GNAT superfamily N-acetyltransferase/heme-degrading monooxygenase HmoA
VAAERADAYCDFLMRVAPADYARIAGNAGCQILRRMESGVAHFLLLSFWDSLDAIRRFAGEPVERARYYPEDASFLLEMEESVVHYELAGGSTTAPREGLRRPIGLPVQGSDGVCVREMIPADAAAVAVLSSQLGYEAAEAAITRRFASLANDPDSLVLVAERDRELVGWVHVLVQRRIEVDPFAEIGGLVVDERARGAGIGAALLAAAEAWARARALPAVRVRSNTIRGDAHRFYRREGYAVLKTQVNFHKSLET